MKKKRGFTLIELLAVIIILAVIALIAVPSILKILNKTRLNAAEDSVYGIVKSVDTYIANFMLKNNGTFPRGELEFECNNNGCILSEETINNLSSYDLTNLDKLDFKGKKPTSGKVTIINNGKEVRANKLIINGYECNYDGEKASCVKGNNQSTSEKINPHITIEPNHGILTYPTELTAQISTDSDGLLTCSSSDTLIATCSISDNTLTIMPGTTEGDTTITVVSSATETYNLAQVAYYATTEKGTLNSITVTSYNGLYDGEEHGITVTSGGSTIKYGIEADNYDLDDSPKYIMPGVYTVYYQVTKTGYQTVNSSTTITINTPTASQISYGDTTVQDAIDDLYYIFGNL